MKMYNFHDFEEWSLDVEYYGEVVGGELLSCLPEGKMVLRANLKQTLEKEKSAQGG